MVGRGLEAWSDPKLAARFTRDYLAKYADLWSVYDNDTHRHDTYAWASNWQDVTKADAFIAEMEQILEAEPAPSWNDHSE